MAHLVSRAINPSLSLKESVGNWPQYQNRSVRDVVNVEIKWHAFSIDKIIVNLIAALMPQRGISVPASLKRREH